MTEPTIHRPTGGGLVDPAGQPLPDATIAQLQEEVDKVSKDESILSLMEAVVTLWRCYAYTRELISMTGNYSQQAKQIFVNHVLHAQLDQKTGVPLPFESIEEVDALGKYVLPLLRKYTGEETKARADMVGQLKMLDKRLREKGLITPFKKLNTADGLMPRGTIVYTAVEVMETGIVALELCKFLVQSGVRVMWVTQQTEEFINTNATQLGKQGVLVVSAKAAGAFVTDTASKVRQVPMVDVILVDGITACFPEKYDYNGYADGLLSFKKYLERAGQGLVIVDGGDHQFAEPWVPMVDAKLVDGKLTVDGEALPEVKRPDDEFKPADHDTAPVRNMNLCRSCEKNRPLAEMPETPGCEFDKRDDPLPCEKRGVPVECLKREEQIVTSGGMTKNPMFDKPKE